MSWSRIRARLTYANVASTMALLLALTAGAPAIAHGVRHALFAHKAGRAKTAAFADKAGTATKAASATTATTAGTAANARAIDGFSASSTAVPGMLLALNSNGTFPPSVFPATPAEVYEPRILLFGATGYLGELHSLDGCTSVTQAVEYLESGEKGTIIREVPGPTKMEVCILEVGLQMDAAFFDWVAANLAGDQPQPQDLLMVGVGDGSSSAVGLSGAVPFYISTPDVEAGGDLGWLTVKIQPEDVSSGPVPTLPASAPQVPVDPASLSVSIDDPTIDDVGLRGITSATWRREIVFDPLNDLFAPRFGPTKVEPADLHFVAGPTLNDLRNWRTMLITGSPDRASILLELTGTDPAYGLQMSFEQAWPARLDPFPRLADGHYRARVYSTPVSFSVGP